MKKILCNTIADKGSVCINGICFPCGDDGFKTVILTDERVIDNYKPYIDTRESTVRIWLSDCVWRCDCAENTKIYDKNSLGTWAVEIQTEPATNTIYLVAYSKITELKK